MTETASPRQERDLALAPGQYAYIQDRTSGVVKIWVGPKGDTLTQNDRLVNWTGRKFIETTEVSQARSSFVVATENQYVVLTDPAVEGAEKRPAPGETHVAITLDVGKRIVIRGPVTFALWPGQTARVIDGHVLNLNQYLVAQVYEPEAAEMFADAEVAEPQPDAEKPKAPKTSVRTYKMGQRIVIRGDERSFYIPQTGIEVLNLEGSKDQFVREAVTLEQLETCTLVDENGTKRYERGPKVVFPEPTETFLSERDNLKFRAVDLAPWQGLHGKVLEDYTDEHGAKHKRGDELFLTGGEDEFGPAEPIFFPRAELSIVLRGDQRKHYATPVPVGEGRYVLNNRTGEVKLIRGPKMLLPDPRSEVLIMRVLDPRVAAAMYPGNDEALGVNVERIQAMNTSQARYLTQDVSATAAAAGSLATSYSNVSGGYTGEKFRRGPQTFSPQPSVTLDTKFLGSVDVEPWPGFAILVRDKTGNRRVVMGSDPNPHVNLEYHEDVQILSFSTGRPKSATNQIRTPYLQVKNNAVGDRIQVETKDLVPAIVEISLRVNFEGDSTEDRLRWFDVDDYVALLTLHVRSRLRNLAKRHGVQKFNDEHIDLIRDELLGPSKDGKRPGRHFEENGMYLYDVEVLDFKVIAPDVAALLAQASNQALQGAIKLSADEQETERHAKFEELERQRIADGQLTAEARAQATLAEIGRDLASSLAALDVELQTAGEQAKADALVREGLKLDAEQEVALLAARNEEILARAEKEVELFVKQANAIDPKLAEAIRTYGQEKVASEIAQALGPYSLIAGGSAVDILKQRLTGTAFSPVLEALSAHPMAELRNGKTE